MTPELEDKLIRRYPSIFQNARSDPSKTCMVWGLSVGDGWYDLIDTLCAELSAPLRQEERKLEYLFEDMMRTDKVVPDHQSKEDILLQEQAVLEARVKIPAAAQVKEKFGSLRFYVHSATPEQYALISFAENMSQKICEVCGNKGQMYALGWVSTLCDCHAFEAHGEKSVEYRAKKEANQE